MRFELEQKFGEKICGLKKRGEEMKKQIGKIQCIKIGMGGHQDAMFGISFTLSSTKDSWGVGDFWGTWADDPGEHAKWTKKSQRNIEGKTFARIKELIKIAKVDDVKKLLGIPVEVTIDGNQLHSWRILEEVI